MDPPLVGVFEVTKEALAKVNLSPPFALRLSVSLALCVAAFVCVSVYQPLSFHRSTSIRSVWFWKRCFLVLLTSYADVEFQLLVAATVQHSAAKGHILVLTRRVDGQVAHGCVEPVLRPFALNLVGGSLDFNSSSGPREGDGRRVEAICTACQMALCFQHQPLLRYVQHGGHWIGGRGPRGGHKIRQIDGRLKHSLPDVHLKEVNAPRMLNVTLLVCSSLEL